MDLLSHFLRCSEKVRTLRSEILATPALADPVQHSRTGNCFPDALSLYSLLTIVLYCIPFSQLYGTVYKRGRPEQAVLRVDLSSSPEPL